MFVDDSWNMHVKAVAAASTCSSLSWCDAMSQSKSTETCEYIRLDRNNLKAKKHESW